MNKSASQEENVMNLPETFVWTRYGTEAGSSFADILRRKDLERAANGGVFLWGIGNNVSSSLGTLLADGARPRVLFSPIKSAPRVEDVEPGRIAVWATAVAPDGQAYQLPRHSVVTSRYYAGKQKHYALICSSKGTLTVRPDGPVVAKSALANAKSGNPLGSSQVTAIVKRVADSASEAEGYRVTFACELVYPYVVTLRDPQVVEPNEEGISNAVQRANQIRKANSYDEQLSFGFGAI